MGKLLDKVKKIMGGFGEVFIEPSMEVATEGIAKLNSEDMALLKETMKATDGTAIKAYEDKISGYMQEGERGSLTQYELTESQLNKKCQEERNSQPREISEGRENE